MKTTTKIITIFLIIGLMSVLNACSAHTNKKGSLIIRSQNEIDQAVIANYLKTREKEAGKLRYVQPKKQPAPKPKKSEKPKPEKKVTTKKIKLSKKIISNDPEQEAKLGIVEENLRYSSDYMIKLIYGFGLGEYTITDKVKTKIEQALQEIKAEAANRSTSNWQIVETVGYDNLSNDNNYSSAISLLRAKNTRDYLLATEKTKQLAIAIIGGGPTNKFGKKAQSNNRCAVIVVKFNKP